MGLGAQMVFFVCFILSDLAVSRMKLSHRAYGWYANEFLIEVSESHYTGKSYNCHVMCLVKQ